MSASTVTRNATAPPARIAPAPAHRRSRRPAHDLEARWRRGWIGPALVLPAVLVFAVYIAYPVVANVVTSFLGNTEIDPALRFVGLDNYEWALSNRASLLAFRNVAIFAALTIPIQMGLGLLLAVGLRGPGLLRTAMRTLLFLPVVLTPVVVGYLYADLLEASNGPVNGALRAIGLNVLAQNWLADPALALPVVALVNVWMWTGFSMAIYQAALTSLDDEVLEAAALDGAGRAQTLWYVIAPMLRPAHFSLLILGMIGTLKTFDLVYVLTRGGPDNASQVPTTLLFQTLLDGRDGRAAAIGTIVLLAALIVTVVQLRQYLKGARA
ncbi:carbohydrate ABC transporter permease [Microbacterium radiodurans]|uniref:Sugar ABC transporter permease n=1 Tax=Microbacterium radiodurans TaxID=661398 RepID=A0A5J5IS08_9MICO|nr:sugar ABC transporter permease [Microbacterium radiodurans]KAA9083746.1 sugar ABC transporter permease [Microbacterium radiodurans]